ncbi:AtpZ/AtpI family protein [Candidatus Ozemobacteraceae bacterium]|nr:AtpZ/AtpI family protein [Candidatus Ozemobacteraceae bacterium]
MGPVLTLGLNVGVSLGLGIAFGFSFDQHFGTDPWGLCIGTAFGLAAALRNAWLVLRRSMESRGR